MKVQVIVSIKSSSDENSTIDLVVSPSETVASLKEKVASLQLIPFPDKELRLAGNILKNEARLSTSGVSEGCLLTLEVRATEATLAQQLSELVQTRSSAVEELGLLYCYKHGCKVDRSLQLLDFKGNFEDFIGNQKSLSIKSGLVTLVSADTNETTQPEKPSLKTFSALDEIVQILKDCPLGIMEIRLLSQKFLQKFGVSLASILDGHPEVFLSKNSLFVVHSHKWVSLYGVRKPKVGSPARVDSPPPTSAEIAVGDPAVLVTTSVPEIAIEPPPGLTNVKDVVVDKDAFALVEVQQYAVLHEAIHSPIFSWEITQTVNDLVAALSETSFLEIDHVVTGGAIGKGVAISGATNAELVFFLSGLPMTHHEMWLPSLLRAVAAVLTDQAQVLGIDGIHIVENAVVMHMLNSVDATATAKVYISPAFENYAKTIEILAKQEPDARRFYTATLAKERTQFVSRQTSSVKMTIRLMKWWRDQQRWSSPMTCPSDELLELATIYSSVQTKPSDQKIAIANVMSLLSRFSNLRVVWSNYYSKEHVWPPLLDQRPLLMDPTNPFINVADPQMFHAGELMELAQTTHFFW